MRGRNHDRKLAVSVVVANVSLNADNHTVIVLIYCVNTNTNIFYLLLIIATSRLHLHCFPANSAGLTDTRGRQTLNERLHRSSLRLTQDYKKRDPQKKKAAPLERQKDRD